MMSEVLPISAENVVGPDSASISGKRSEAGLVLGEGKEKTAPQGADLKAVSDELNHNLNRIHTVNLQFSVHEGSGKLLVLVTDAVTGEVIREIPPSELLDLAARMDEMVGLLFDQMG